jgi:hypothetical protein
MPLLYVAWQALVFVKPYEKPYNFLIFNVHFFNLGAANAFLACLLEKTRTAAAAIASRLYPKEGDVIR